MSFDCAESRKTTGGTEQKMFPDDIAIIMDGNDHWAESKGKHHYIC